MNRTYRLERALHEIRNLVPADFRPAGSLNAKIADIAEVALRDAEYDRQDETDALVRERIRTHGQRQRAEAAERYARHLEREIGRHENALTAHHNIANLSDIAIATSIGGPCRICRDARDLDDRWRARLELVGDDVRERIYARAAEELKTALEAARVAEEGNSPSERRRDNLTQ